MPTPPLFPRYIEPRLTEALADSPVVLIHGPRQCGKTTLAEGVGTRQGYSYISFDDDVAREAASADPVGFMADLPERSILDEVQRVPALFATSVTPASHARSSACNPTRCGATVLCSANCSRRSSCKSCDARRAGMRTL
jgi:uncharacterized protein